jgi:ABC-2 type transport system permease protein
MGEIGLLVRNRRVQIRNHLFHRGLVATIRQHSALKISVVLLFGILLWLGLFLLFLDGFRLIDRTMPDLKLLLMGMLFNLFFTALSIMLTFSNGIISFTALFRSQETGLLFSNPIRGESIFAYRMVESLVFSTWAFFFMGLPLIFAYGYSCSVPWFFYPVSVAFFVAFAPLPAAVGSTAALVIGAYFAQSPRRIIIGLLTLAVLVCAVWLLRAYPAFYMGTKSYEIWVRDVLGKLSWTENPLLPSHWIAQGVMKLGGGAWRESLFYLLLLASNSLFAATAAYWIAAAIYAKGYQTFQGISRRRRYYGIAPLDRIVLAALFWVSPPIRWMVQKDVRSFRRDAAQWSHALIFFGLIAVYVLNLRFLKYDVQRLDFRNMVAFLNLAATSLTLASFTSRFVFPLLSLEGRRFWVLGLAPFGRHDILLGKFIFSFAGCFVISATLMTASDLMLNVGQLVTILHLFSVSVISAGLSGLSVGLGAIYMDLREDSPSRIVSGFGGTLNLVLSMVFVGVVVAVLAVPCHLYIVKGIISDWVFRLWIAGSLVVIVGAGIACCVIPLTLGRRALDRLEV